MELRIFLDLSILNVLKHGLKFEKFAIVGNKYISGTSVITDTVKPVYRVYKGPQWNMKECFFLYKWLLYTRQIVVKQHRTELEPWPL